MLFNWRSLVIPGVIMVIGSSGCSATAIKSTGAQETSQAAKFQSHRLLAVANTMENLKRTQQLCSSRMQNCIESQGMQIAYPNMDDRTKACQKNYDNCLADNIKGEGSDSPSPIVDTNDSTKKYCNDNYQQCIKDGTSATDCTSQFNSCLNRNKHEYSFNRLKFGR